MNASFADFGAYQPGLSMVPVLSALPSAAVAVRAKVSHFVSSVLYGAVQLPTAPPGETLVLTILNRGSKPLAVYPPGGGQIESLGMDTPAGMIQPSDNKFIAFGAPYNGAQWYVAFPDSIVNVVVTFILDDSVYGILDGVSVLG